MSYYQGDYYVGDYYRGDPFLGLGKLWGGIKKVGKAFLGMGGGGGGGGMTGEQFREVMASQRPQAAGIGPGIAGGMGSGGAMGLARMGGWGTTAARMRGQGEPGFDIMPGPGRLDPMALLPGGRPLWSSGQCEPGWHLNKQMSHGRETHGALAGTICVRNRRMNVANPRALRRGLRRVAGFGKLAQRARRDIGRAATAVGAGGRRRGPVARHHARIRAKA